jgi:hypothetical protein
MIHFVDKFSKGERRDIQLFLCALNRLVERSGEEECAERSEVLYSAQISLGSSR